MKMSDFICPTCHTPSIETKNSKFLRDTVYQHTCKNGHQFQSGSPTHTPLTE